jgi:hypothetical protein
MDLRPFFEFLRPVFVGMDSTWLANVIKDSRWWFPVIETIHVLGFAILMGSTFLVDMHFFGISMNRQPMSRIAKQLWPWTLFGLWVTFLTGVLMMVSESIKCLENQAFWWKMVFFVAAIVFQGTLHKRLTLPEDAHPSPAAGRIAGIVSVLLWCGVFVGGRAIGFV